MGMIYNKKAQKTVFWEALIVAILIFSSGIFLGYLLEKSRLNAVLDSYQKSELDLLDVKIQNDILSFEGLNCTAAINSNMELADRVFEEAKILEDYEESNKLTEDMKLQHKKYDLLRTIIWTNSIKIKNKCGYKFDTLVYFYNYLSEDTAIISEQEVFSKKLEELKAKKSDSLILIPIAGNIDASSINYLKMNYGIDKLPTILINEKVKIDSLNLLGDMDKYLK